MSERENIGAVIIGRNEGQRLIRCIESLQNKVDCMVYVDSGSTDDSVQVARQLGAEVIDLDTQVPFTAARARNAGFSALLTLPNPPNFVQFVDGDCEIQSDWLEAGLAFLTSTPNAAVACGRRRERFPNASVYNQLIDIEWNTPIGKAKSCGGDAIIRKTALVSVGGYNPTLIAGEEPELCVRLRQAGWEIWRLDTEMTLHDASIMKFVQWWNRIRRGGYAFAEGAYLHGYAPERHFVKETCRALIWGAVLPVVALLGMMITPWSLILLLLWPIQILRLRIKGKTWVSALFLTVSKFPEALGAFNFYWRTLSKNRASLIEYK